MRGFVISVYYCIIHVYVLQQHRATSQSNNSTEQQQHTSGPMEVRARQIYYERFGKNKGIRFEISICPKGKIRGLTAATDFHGIRF
jgi:hypothetical protein